MKKNLIVIIPLLLICLLAVSSLFSKGNSIISFGENKLIKQKNFPSDNFSEHLNQSLTCKTCHVGEYPTKRDPELRSCPRENMLSDFPSPMEGPKVILIGEMSENYTGVVFSHRVHSQMSEMSMGCTDCHHYNTTGKVLNCRECHEKNRFREDVSVPDLKAAFHRQCMSCHKEWSHENGCNSQCHTLKNSQNQKTIDKSLYDKEHPKRTEPSKMIFETNYEQEKIVTFFHDEHNKLFKINCTQCHVNDKCIKCHDKQKILTDYNKPIQEKKTFDERHKLCMNCHKGNACDKCHNDKELSPFNHGRATGWVLKGYHIKLACEKCHGNQTPIKKLDRNCKNCHSNFVPGKFDHGRTGLVLSENHKDFECNNCHVKDDFCKSPECKMCHDDKSYPVNLPGKKRGK